jgi:Flp pilus assembly protein TadD
MIDENKIRSDCQTKRRWSFFVFGMTLLLLLVRASSLKAEEDITALVKKISPSVVSIFVYNETGKLISQGSGFFITTQGEAITNRHVLEGATWAEIKIATGKIYPVNLVLAEDAPGDLVRFSVNIPAKKVVPLSVSAVVPSAGEKIIVIGSPLGLEQTVTEGVVSAVRNIPEVGKILQISAPISPGSSGSPVVNLKGEVIGIATLQMVEEKKLNFAVSGERVTKLSATKGKALATWAEKGKNEAKAEKIFRLGMSWYWSKNYKKAVPYLEESTKLNPHDADAFFYLGVAYGYLERHQEEIDAYKQAIRINPNYADAHYDLGVACGYLGRWQEAVEAFKEAVRINPDDAEAHNNLGVAFKKLGRLDEAIDAYKQAISINPNYAKAHYNLGVAYLGLGDKSSALDEYKVLNELDKESADTLFTLIQKEN